MYSGTTNFVFLVFFSATIIVFCSPIAILDQLQHHLNKRATAVLKFEGCFGDTTNRVLNSATKIDAADNTNNVCVNKCAERGFAISSTKGSSCYCTNVLPLPRLYKANEKKASGSDGPCSTACPGTRAAQRKIACQGDECCGGPSAYSVYLSGDIDVLKQLLRRVTSNEMKRLGYDKKKLGNNCISPGLSIMFIWLCASYTATDVIKYYGVSAIGRSVNSQGLQGIKNCTLKTGFLLGTEKYSCVDIASMPAKHANLEVKSMEKLMEYVEPVAEKLATDYDIVNDNLKGAKDLKLSKSYQVTTSFSESWSTEHGFDISITVGAEFEAGALFAKATTTFELSTGYSFSSGYEKSKGRDVTESFSVETVASPGTKVVTRFFKSEAPVEVKWRANIFTSGYVLIEDRADKRKVSEPNIVGLLTYDERKFFAFGTMDYGQRKMMIARSETRDRNGKLVQVKNDTKAIKK